jgi:GAF domain-containing protein
MTTSLDLAGAMVQAAREINARHDIPSTLDAIVRTAKSSLPGVDHVGITIAHTNGRMETKAATDDLVWQLDELQYELREGPCVHAIERDQLTVVEHAGQDKRWPRFMPKAVALGLKAQMGVRLYADEHTIGGLNVYSTEAETFPEGTDHLAQLFAAHAALALGRTRREEELNTALATRTTISTAVGIVMQTYHLDQERAFRYLVRVSSHSNVKLRDVAREVVEDCEARFSHDANGRDMPRR